MDRFVALGLLGVGCALVLACGRAPLPVGAPPHATGALPVLPAAASAAPPSGDFAAALQDARQLRQAAAAMIFTAVGGGAATDEQVKAFDTWLLQRQASTEKAERAYEGALERASPSEQVQVRRELGDVYLELFDAKLRGSLALFPSANEPPRAGAVGGNPRQRYAADAAKAREYFGSCFFLAAQLRLENDDRAHCIEQARTLDSIQPQPPDKSLEAWRSTRLQPSQRARRSTQQVAPCQLSGSAAANVRFYAAPTGVDYALALDDFDVVSLELPERAEQRVKLSIDYPFRASGYVEAPLVASTRRIELVKDHIWLDPGTELLAFAPANGQVSVEVPEAGKSTPKLPSSVPCSQLELLQPVASAVSKAKGETSALTGSVPLLAAPHGKQIGQLDLDESSFNVRVLSRRRGWVHVSSEGAGLRLSYVPYELDAWISETYAPRGQGGVDFGKWFSEPATRAPTHVTTAALPLRLLPDARAPIVAELVVGVGILAGAEQNGMRRIRCNEASGHDEGEDFWVKTADLAAATSAWNGAAAPR